MTRPSACRPTAARTLVVLVAAVGLAGCQTTGTATNASGGANGRWAIDSVAAKCTQSVIGGAIVGALIGAAFGGKSGIGQGALVGGAAGVGLCAVIVALNAQDRARIRDAQLAAARTNQPQVLSYQGDDGLRRDIAVRPARTVAATRSQSGTVTVVGDISAATDAAELAGKGQLLCRELHTEATVATKGSATVPPQMICRQPDGTYAPQTIVAGG
ncbi:hypothetical protein [Bauldia litoralis]|uniref:hypothetical protein n=1 Tax=Bauldia litoralis TaxID=665467 RepID=UPI00329893C0